MCIHPTIKIEKTGCLDAFGRTTLSSSIFDEITDPCHFVDSIKELDATDSDLIIMHYNIRSLFSKIDSLNSLLQETSVDVCLLNESWLNDYNRSRCNFVEYNLESVEHSHRKGGGVGILISKDLDYKRVRSLELKSNCFESCVVDLKPSNGKILMVASLYRPPNSNVRDFMTIFNCFLNKISDSNKEYIIGMDHNFDLLKYSKHDLTQDLLELILDHGMFPAIALPTRITKTTATLIDNIFESKNLFKNYTIGVLINDLSDHLPCLLVSQGARALWNELRQVYCKKITPKIIKLIQEKLKRKDWSNIVYNKDLNSAFESFHNNLLSIVDSEAPYCKFTPSTKRLEPWLTPGFKKCIKKLLSLYKDTLHSGSN